MERFIWHQYNRVFCIFFFSFIYICFQVHCSSSSSFLCPPDQSSALLQFKNTITVGSEPHFLCDKRSSPKTASWTENSDCCSWHGVTCDHLTGNVIGLNLECSWLEGTIEDNNTLFHLSYLRRLNLAKNDFDGSKISPEFGRLRELTHLDLSWCLFHGLVPSEISQLSKLNSLILSSSTVDYLTIDQQNFDLLVHNLTRLSVLNLKMINMTAVTPSSLLNVSSSMKVLNLGWTGIQGKFPEEIFHLPNLQKLYVFLNEGVTGYLPKFNRSSSLRVLDLSFTNFKGEIPDSIGNQRFLEVINMEWCNFSGSIPKSVGNLTRLTELQLPSNHFTGQLPSLSKLEKIKEIKLSNNNFSGPIPYISVNFSSSTSSNNFSAQLPYHVSGFSHLRTLDLSQNIFNGSVPSWLFTLPSLVSIDLRDNMITGPFAPFKLHYYSSLKEVYLENNNIHGPIPSSIFELVNLTTLHLSSNKLSGSFTFDMLSKLKNLEELDVSNNSLLSFRSSSNTNYSLPKLKQLNFSFCNVSEFPNFLRTSEKLELLDLSNNTIHGWISNSESGGWKSLTYLDLSNNFLTHIEHPWKNITMLDLRNNKIQGSILVPPPSTEVFAVSNNQLAGQLPPSICKLSSLRYLSFSDNHLSGTIPSCLGNLTTSLVKLHLQRNKLQGSIPDTFVNGSLLTSLDLSENKLEGPLPRSLANCSELEVFNVGNNTISDTFPCWLGTLPELKILILRSSKFYGPLCNFKTISPFHNLRIIDLSHNEFTGSLPTRIFASMEAMMNASKDESQDQYMGGAYYYDSVNVTMKGRNVKLGKILTIFTSIDLSRNQFQGEIPEVLGNFKSLLVLNLSHNSLRGHIPISFPNLTALESLDLSFNKLDGTILEQLTEVHTLEVLNLSYNRLWGRIPRLYQFSTFENDSFIGNKDLCGEPLSVKCENDVAATKPSPSSVSHEDDETASGFDWKITMMGYASGVVIGISTGYIIFSTGKPQWLVRMVEERLLKKGRRSSQRQRRTKTKVSNFGAVLCS